MSSLNDLVKTLRKIAAVELDFEKEIKQIAAKFSKDFANKIIDSAPTEKRTVTIIGTDGQKRRANAAVLVSGTELDDFILRLPKLLEKSLKDVGFTGKAQAFVQNFSTVQAANVSFHEAQNKRKLNREIVGKITRNMQNLVVNQLASANGILATSLLGEIRQNLQSNAISSVPLTTSIDQISDLIAGAPDASGEFARIATLVSRDGYYQFQGKIDQELATEFGYNAYRYIGSLVDESRAQCVRWSEKEYILFSELEAEIDWAYKYGSGMYKGTTPANFSELRGGYNCRHFAIPVFIEIEEKEAEL